MAAVFISYSLRDKDLAETVYKLLISQGVDVFMAHLSLKPGDHWPTEIFNKLNACSWVIVLASKNAFVSNYVIKEINMALAKNKKIIPIVWDCDPAELPKPLNAIQTLDLRNSSFEKLQSEIAMIAKKIHSDKQVGFLLVGALITGLLLLAKKGK